MKWIGRCRMVPDTASEPPIVAYVGRGPTIDPNGRFRLEHVDPGSIATYAPHADCVVLEVPGGGLDALRRLRGTATPTVLYDRTADPTVAARATRAGVTEYVVDDGSRKPIDRIADLAGVGEGRPPEPNRTEAAMSALRRAVSDGSNSLTGTIERVLEAGRTRFGVEFGALSRIDGTEYAVVAGDGDDPATLSETYCHRTVRLDRLCCLPDTARALGTGDVTGVFSRLGCYFGATVVVDGDRYGTLWFGDGSPRGDLSGAERQFLELLADVAGSEVVADGQRRTLRAESDRHERAVTGLVEAGAAVRDAGSPDRIAEIAVAAAERITTVDIGAVRLFEGDRTVAVATTDDGASGGGTDAPVSHSGELLIGDGSGEGGVEAASAAIPIGDQGVLSIADGTSRIAEPDRRRLSLLATVVESALCRIDGETEPSSDTDRETTPAASNGDRFRHLFDALPDPTVDVEFVDDEPIVRRVNDAFERTFGYDGPAIRERSLAETIVPDGLTAEAERLGESALRRGREPVEVERLTADGRRTFLFRGFSYRYDGTERGFGVYADVTDRLEQERRLRVLHRVLRHNLRNDMTAILGYADMLASEGPSEECRDHAERIYERAMEVSDLGEQVRRIQQALDVDRQRVGLDPGPLVTDIVERFRSKHPEASIRVSTDDAEAVVGDELLKIAVENLIENAIEHHPGRATVDIEVAPADGGWVDISVSDDGSGIPERERAVVSGSREITQLDHSVGLGLWLSRWVVAGVDGKLMFGDCETGSEVTLRLRRADGRTADR